MRPPMDTYYATGYRDGNKFYYPSPNTANGQPPPPPSPPLQPVQIGSGGGQMNGNNNNIRGGQWQSAAGGSSDGSNSNQIPLSNYGPQNIAPSLGNANRNWPSNAIIAGNNNNNMQPPGVVHSTSPGQQQQQHQQRPPQAELSPPVAPVPNQSSVPGQPPKETSATKAADNKVNQKNQKKVEAEEESDEDDSGSEEATEAAPAPKKGKSRGKHRKLEDKGMPTFPPIYQQLKAIGSELDGERVDHDGASDRPTGAVVSLVIGVSVTAILAIFIGCRMKAVTAAGRMRMRRGGKGPFAHDADYLVNGMYL